MVVQGHLLRARTPSLTRCRRAAWHSGKSLREKPSPPHRLRNAAAERYAAHWASWCVTLPVVRARAPAVADRLNCRPRPALLPTGPSNLSLLHSNLLPHVPYGQFFYSYLPGLQFLTLQSTSRLGALTFQACDCSVTTGPKSLEALACLQLVFVFDFARNCASTAPWLFRFFLPHLRTGWARSARCSFLAPFALATQAGPAAPFAS